MKTLFALCGLALLAACTTLTPEQQAAVMEREVDEMIRIYGPACERLGYKTDTDLWRDCILRLSSDDRRYQYMNRPTTTSCVGRRGFFNCTTF